MEGIVVDTWLYGELANYARELEPTSDATNDFLQNSTSTSTVTAGYANVQVELSEGSMIRDLLACLKMPSQARGITFINGELSAMPGMQPDLDHPLKDGDRVAFFHLRAMWPFQYRSGVPMNGEMSSTMGQRDDRGLRHAYKDGVE